jgi:hypothetical protein
MYTLCHAEAFPRAERYRTLLSLAAGTVKEPTPFPWSERHLRCLWYDSQYRPAAFDTADGQQVTVIDPGRWNLEAGPDFRDATLVAQPGARRMHGDVELHVRPAEWDQHGHRTDPRYRRLIAHVSWFPGLLPSAALPPGTLQIALQPAFKSRPSFSFDALDLTSYPYATLDDEPPCRAPLRTRPPEEQAAVLEAAGQERLRRKAARMSADIAARGADQVLYEDTLAALGYKHNRQPFRDLAARLPQAMLREQSTAGTLHAYALLCGVSGLLPRRAAPGWDDETRAFVRSLWDLWWRHAAAWSGRTLLRDEWVLANCRPPNQPLRRLMAAAEWFGAGTTLADHLRALATRPAAEFMAGALTLLEGTGRDTFWATRQGLSADRLSRPLALVGRGRAASLLLNVVVPWLAALGHTRLAAATLPLLPPEDDNQGVRHTAHALFGHDHNPALYRTGLRQQGLLQVFHDFCLNVRNGCQDCSFPQALERWAEEE